MPATVTPLPVKPPPATPPRDDLEARGAAILAAAKALLARRAAARGAT